MKNIYLMRHAHPVNGHPMDGTRALDEHGRKQAKDMADFLVKEIGRVDIVITSPFTRAMETASVMADALGSHVADTRMLEPDGTPAEIWAEVERLAQQSTDVLIVGHDPSINAFTAWLMGVAGDEDEECPGLRFAHGAIAWLKMKGNRGALQWLATAKLVHRDEEEQEALEAMRELYEILG